MAVLCPILETCKEQGFRSTPWHDSQTWPGADRKNISSFAAFVRLLGRDVYISIEFSDKDTAKARALAKAVGYEEKKSPGAIIRLLTKRIPIKGEDGLAQAVNEAMDEFCKVGENVTTALNSMEV